jgi:hypothetical protein
LPLRCLDRPGTVVPSSGAEGVAALLIAGAG